MAGVKGFARGFALALLVLAGCTGGPISDFPRGSSDEPTPGESAGDGDQSGSFDAGATPDDSSGDGDSPPDSDGPGMDGGVGDAGPSDGGAADAGDASADASLGDAASDDAGG